MMNCNTMRKAHDYAMLLNGCILVLAFFVCVITGSAWGLAALVFLVRAKCNSCPRNHEECSR